MSQLCSKCEKFQLEDISQTQLYCPNCNVFFEKSLVAGELEKTQLGKEKELKPMAGKRPTYRIVIGKRTVGVLWDAVAAKSGLKYHSGNIDVTELKSAVSEKGTQKKSVRVNREGATAEHDMIRVALFEAKNDKQETKSGSW